MRGLTVSGFLGRFALALALVVVTYNPTPYSYYSWLRSTGWQWSPLIVLAGIVLLTGWVVYLRATARSLGAIGLVLACAFFAALFWLFTDWGWIPLDSATAITWVAMIMVAAILAIGMSWSHLRRRWSGQADVTELDEK
ncbi:MAG: DUF6524 family protein [Candidatus Rokuibacteriota bacterium]